MVTMTAMNLPLLSRWRDRKLRTHRRTALPEALRALSGMMKAGCTLPRALELYVSGGDGPLIPVFQSVLHDYRMGQPLDEALHSLERLVPGEDTTMLVSAVAISRTQGGNLAEVVGRIAEVMRRKQELEAKVKSLTAQGRLQGWVMGLLPVLIALALYQLEPEVMNALVSTPAGWGVLAVAMLMEGVGIAIIRKIVNVDI